jgi:hypothetical protein
VCIIIGFHVHEIVEHVLTVRSHVGTGGKQHKEIFRFRRTPDAPYAGKEWDMIVDPIIKRWGKFLAQYLALDQP